MPVLQTMGMYVRGGLRDTESGGSFEHLARKYLVESDGRNRTAVCKVNAEVSALFAWGVSISEQISIGVYRSRKRAHSTSMVATWLSAYRRHSGVH